MSAADETSEPRRGDDGARGRGNPVARLWRWFRNFKLVRVALSPATHFSLAFLTLGGFVMGVIFWGGFNTGWQ